MEQKQSLAALMSERGARAQRQAERLEQRAPYRSLLAFMRSAWPLVVPNAPFVEGWHIEAICSHLEAQSRGELPRLVINVPPGSSKSTTVCVMWCAWEWTFNPGCQWQYGAYGETLAVRDSLRCRALMTSDWYRELWGDVWEPKKNGWLVDSLENDKGGSRQAISVGGAPTGFHAHRQVVDDPLKALDAHSVSARERARVWWWEAMASRMLPGDNTRTIIMQRLHDADLAAQAKEQGYAVLSIPMVYSIAARREPTPIGWTDPRTRDGELLCEARWDAVEVARRKREFGPDGWAAQDQQDPVPEGGAIYREEWLAQFYPARMTAPALYGMQVIQSVDCAFKSHETSSYVCAQVWAYKPPNFWLLDEIRDHLDFLATVAAVKTLRARWPMTTAILIEDKANGPAVINSLSTVPGVLAIEPLGSKVARAYATQPVFAAGNVWLPDPSLCPWIWDWITEHKRFPAGVANDRVDAQTQAITYFVQGGAAEYLAALDAV
jgi:predicted phage terminase large subunit-like protein